MTSLYQQPVGIAFHVRIVRDHDARGFVFPIDFQQEIHDFDSIICVQVASRFVYTGSDPFNLAALVDIPSKRISGSLASERAIVLWGNSGEWSIETGAFFDLHALLFTSRHFGRLKRMSHG